MPHAKTTGYLVGKNPEGLPHLGFEHLVPLLSPPQPVNALLVHLGSHLLVAFPLLPCGTLVLDGLDFPLWKLLAGRS